jgi:hypothetical protein
MRPRRYVPRYQLILMRPLLRYSPTRNAFVLRFVGNHTGPVLLRDFRHSRRAYSGRERRQTLAHR